MKLFLIFILFLLSLNNINKPENLIKSKTMIEKEREKGLSENSIILKDDGDGFGEKITKLKYENVLKLDKWIQLKGNFYVCGTRNDIINVYQCSGICRDNSIPIQRKKKVQICNYSSQKIKNLYVIGDCKCKYEKYEFKNQFNGEFFSPFGKFVINVNLEQENDLNLKNSKFKVNQNTGEIEGDSNVKQSGKSNLQVDSDFIPS